MPGRGPRDDPGSRRDDGGKSGRVAHSRPHRLRACEWKTWDVRNDVEGLLTRDEVEEVLATGIAWRVRWCPGGGLPPESGAGLRAPMDAVRGVPTKAQLGKYQAGRSDKTLVFARVVEVDGAKVLDLREAGS